MTKLVKVQDAKANLSQLIREAEAGETVIVTRHGKPTVRLAVVEPEPETGPVRMAIEAFRNVPKGDIEFERDRTPWGEMDLDFD
ncbi:type II toxin-antitoxin system Phd/YefM family antitoxin [Deinococcus aestuarii]|uniref:type II toxin-antitoxin system Phd/YefM family antitoxin n=1 Tax=Deinococcus aestuarii TaxID=2774531 RepID=UPI001C0C587F|nr:type II toxin-antitoxin system prevent-host-death family antitoxin [Deinococcus aestuarii]